MHLFFCLSIVAALLALAPSPQGQVEREGGVAAAADAAPDAAWTERDYLLHYAEAVCLRAAYATLEPAPAAALEALDAEAWAMVEFTRQDPEVYNSIHNRASAEGRHTAPARALAACTAWVRRDAAEILKPVRLSD